jgi:hypothetical protein
MKELRSRNEWLQSHSKHILSFFVTLTAVLSIDHTDLKPWQRLKQEEASLKGKAA